MPPQHGWAGLFLSAFKRSRNPMVLLDDRRCHVEVNGAYLRLVGCRRETLIGHPLHEVVVGCPLASPREWQALLNAGQFTGVADLIHRDGHKVTVQWRDRRRAVHFASHGADAVRNAMIKLGVCSRAQLVARSLGPGIALESAAK